ncbi:hypothetical protein SSX86_032030 [Deinandra increscens subsp. villosa]|uniref:Photosystem II reaction center protein Z n=1 Tax=Deinandra increscens subsp. villosa TaxID=3103831 RepID=A0AAP0GI53_9ASTR
MPIGVPKVPFRSPGEEDASWVDIYMTLAFQLAVFALIATSSILLISVPVVFASPDGWSSNKNVVFSGTSLWIGLVFLVGILNSLIS